MKKNIKKILVSIFVLIVALVMYIVTRGSYLEYKELGDKYLEIFKTNTIYQYSIMAINFVVTFFIMYFTNRGIKKGLKVFFDEEKKEMPELMNKSISLVIAIVSSVAVGIVFTPKVILYASNVSFEKTDLVFNLDISFYMFVEPLIKMILSYVMGIFIFLIVYSIVYYIFVIVVNVSIVFILLHVSSKNEQLPVEKKPELNQEPINISKCPACGSPEVGMRYCINCGNKLRE